MLRRSVIPRAALALMMVGFIQAAEPPVAVAPMPRAVAPRLPVAPMPRVAGEIDLTNVDIGIDAALPEVGVERIKDLKPPAVADPTAVVGDPGFAVGLRQEPFAKQPAPFAGRTGATKAKLLKEGGGTAESEKAVALGLEWLAEQQKKDGSWAFDAGNFRQETVAATGLTLLAFFGAGETHKTVKGKHTAAVKNGVQWLTKAVTLGGMKPGSFAGTTQAYSQGIGTLALAEVYGMTKDPAIKLAAQTAVNFIQKAQGPNGSWGYTPGTAGDTSITGWQVQALHTAKQAGLAVDERVLKKAVQFLDGVAIGKEKSMYGYNTKDGVKAGTALTASGLWTRACIDGWGPDHPGIAEGITGMLKNPPVPKTGGIKGLYYSYYASLVIHRTGGDDWATWNEGPKDDTGARKGGMRDWLIGQQIKDGANAGSWAPETGWFGTEYCGRLGTTAVCVLHLEVYYRHVPSEKEKKEPEK